MNTPSRSVRAVVMSTAMVTTGIVSSVAAAPAAQASYTTCRPSPDTVPAVVDSVSFDKPTVDLSNGPSPITVSVHATDYGNAAPTGVRLMRIQLVGPMNEVHTKLALTSGTAIDGTWSHTFKLPAATVSGQFHVRLLEVMDHQQNTDYYIREGKYPTSPFDPRLQADWSDFTVVGGAPARTLPRGKVTSFSFNRRSVDTRRAPMPIRASASFSGTQPTAVLLYLVGRSHMGRPYLEHLHLHRSAHHIWSRRIVIPQWTGDATVRAELHLVYADNVKPHERNLRFRTNALRRHQAFDVRSQIDDTKPALTGLSIPSSVDVTSGAQKIPVSATTSDAQSGVAGMVLRFYPAGHHSVGYSYAKLEQDGNSWSGTARIRPVSPRVSGTSGSTSRTTRATTSTTHPRGSKPPVCPIS